MASTTEKFIKSRAAKNDPVKTGQWHADFSTVKKFADSNKIPLLAVWSNGDACSHCTHFENVCMDSKFKTWAKTSGVAMWFGYVKDTSAEDKFEGKGFTFARNNTLTAYPFVRLYWKAGKVDICKSGDDWTGGIKYGNASKCATKFVKALTTALKDYNPASESAAPEPSPEPAPVDPGKYKVRFNEKLTVASVNKILDAIDNNDGYCPCQIKDATTKCQCADFKDRKGMGVPCICNLYVKQPVDTAKKSAKVKAKAKSKIKAKVQPKKTSKRK